MPKKIPEQELEAILAIVADHPDGVQVRVIRDGLEFDLPPRMLQRRLALLIEQKRLVAEGRGKGRRYRLPVISGEAHLVSGGAKPGARGEVYVQVSPEGAAIRFCCSANRAVRNSCGLVSFSRGSVLCHQYIK